MPVVPIPTPLRPQTGGLDVVDASGTTVLEATRRRCQAPSRPSRPHLRRRRAPPVRQRYVNNEDIRYLDDLGTKVAEGDEISIIPAIAGG